MKVVIAIDSLKGSMTSLEAGNAIKEGILRACDAEVVVKPLADGGEGTIEALTLGMGGGLRQVLVTGPLGEKVRCHYGIIASNQMAIIEMASAAGITLVPEPLRNPMETTTYGVGEMIRDAILQGCRRFIVGIGGSATNDGGVGMLQALGYKFLDESGNQIAYGAKGLKDLVSISDKNVLKELEECTFKIACDVENPLCGPKGCSAIYGPQKGADKEMIQVMDSYLAHYAEIAKTFTVNADPEVPGAGAAGGLGFAFLAFTKAVLESGVSIILKEIGLEEDIKDADWIVTGEGRLDEQTPMGKAPSGVAKLAKKYHKKVIAFAGSVDEKAVVCNQNGIDAFFPILRRISTLNEAMKPKTAKENMVSTVEQVFRLIQVR